MIVECFIAVRMTEISSRYTLFIVMLSQIVLTLILY